VSQSDLTICSKYLSSFIDTTEHFALSPPYVYLDNLCSSSTEELLYILLGRVQNLRTHCPDIEDDVNTFMNICAKYLRVYFSHRIINWVMFFLLILSLFKELFSIVNSKLVIDSWNKCYLYISVQEELKNIYICGIMLWVKGRGDLRFVDFGGIVDHQCLDVRSIIIYA
jgi:hypothetical protein